MGQVYIKYRLGLIEEHWSFIGHMDDPEPEVQLAAISQSSNAYERIRKRFRTEEATALHLALWVL